MSRIPADVVQAVQERAGGYCEAGGAPLTDKPDLHHRKNRGSGGKGALDTVENLLLAHHACHMAVHNPSSVGLDPGFSKLMGWTLETNESPAGVPVQVFRGLCSITGARRSI